MYQALPALRLCGDSKVLVVPLLPVAPAQVTRRILCATGLVVIGCVLLVVFGSRRSESLDVPQLLELYKNPAYITYLAVGTVAAAASFALYWFGNKALK